MNRRSFIRLAAMAAGALGLAPRLAPAAPAPSAVKPDLPPRKLLTDLYPRGMTVYGDGTGQQWILDPTCPRDQVYTFNPRDFTFPDDAKMMHGLARFEFRQREMWPRASRITGINAEIPDAL